MYRPVPMAVSKSILTRNPAMGLTLHFLRHAFFEAEFKAAEIEAHSHAAVFGKVARVLCRLDDAYTSWFECR